MDFNFLERYDDAEEAICKLRDIDERICTSCQDTYSASDIDEEIEHYRKCLRGNVDIRRPDSVGICDDHGWTWYCFSCEKNNKGGYKNHRSFQSQGMLDHLRFVHNVTTSYGKYYVERVKEILDSKPRWNSLM